MAFAHRIFFSTFSLLVLHATMLHTHMSYMERGNAIEKNFNFLAPKVSAREFLSLVGTRVSRLKGGGRKSDRKSTRNPENKYDHAETPHQDDAADIEGQLSNQKTRHRRYFRRNRFASADNKDFAQLFGEWEKNWNDETGYDLKSLRRPSRPDERKKENTGWYEVNKIAKKKGSKSRASNATLPLDADQLRMQAERKRVEALLGIR
jgi:hypothetical protein